VDNGVIFLAALFGGVFVIAIVAIVSGVRHEARKRELSHIERMKALELGQPLPGDPISESIKALRASRDANAMAKEAETPAGLARLLVMSTMALPGLAVAASVIFNIHGSEAIAMWVAVAAVASTCAICGTLVALVPTRGASDQASPGEKPRFDADFEAPPEPTMALHAPWR
jgi:Flp pilus assembly protein TadB